MNLALTSEACYKGLPKTSTGEVLQFKGWPRLNWFITEHLARPPKEWNPPPRLTDDTPAYVEYTTQQVTRQPRRFQTLLINFDQVEPEEPV